MHFWPRGTVELPLEEGAGMPAAKKKIYRRPEHGKKMAQGGGGSVWDNENGGMGRGQALRLQRADLTPRTPESNENPTPKYRLGNYLGIRSQKII